MAGGNTRTAEQVRRDIETKREQLTDAVDDLRAGMDITAKLRAKLPVVAVGALGAGFLLAGGIGATMRLLARRGREGLDVFKRTAASFMEDDCMGLSQQIAYSALLAFLPSVILLIGLLGLFGTGAFNSLEQFVGSVAPHAVISMIDLAKKDAAHNKSGSAIALLVGLFTAVWAASGAMGAVVKAVNR